MKQIKTLLTAFYIISVSMVYSSDVLAQSMPETYSDGSYGRLEYGFYIPENHDSGTFYPLVMFLHGWSANQTVWLDLYNHELQERHPCFVFTPKTPTSWADWSGWNDTSLSEPMLAALHVLDSLKLAHNIDTCRLYVYGISMGGEGVFDLLHKLPGTFSSAISICGGGQAWWAENIAKTPLWMFHGSEDKINTPDLSERVYNRLMEIHAGYVRYTNYRGYGHAIWDRALSEPDFYDWMFSFSRRTE